MTKDADFFINNLNLMPHPEGGYYNEIFRSDEIIKNEALPDRYNSDRNFSTSIYFLLTSNECSKFHILQSDELWYYHAGSTIEIYILNQNGELKVKELGLDIKNNHYPQVVIPKNTYFAAKIKNSNSFTLMGCMVAPGFDFIDFKLADREELIQKYPEHKEIIIKLT